MEHKKRRPPRGEVAGLASRRLAAEVVDHVLKARAALDETLDQALLYSELDDRDAGLVRAIATTTFRHLGSLDATLQGYLESGLPKKAAGLRSILLTGAAQILDLDVPDHSAVDLAVQLTKGDNRTAPYGALVNAVLRRIAGSKQQLLAARDPLDHDTPAWLRSRWIAAYGLESARAIAAAHGREAALDITARADAVAVAEALGAFLLPTGSIRLLERRPVSGLPGFEAGEWWVQDAAAALPAQYLAAQPGETVLDLCAAPGGKTAQLAAAGARVIAVDRSAKRLERLALNMERLKLQVETRVGDAVELDLPQADAVLLDAPCSATGTLRRHPEIAWTKSDGDIAKLAVLQARLLDRAAALVKPGGRIVYCTCSLEPEEGEAQAHAFLARNGHFTAYSAPDALFNGLAGAKTQDGFVRTIPVMLSDERPRAGGLDGFFIAGFRRQS